MNRSNIDLVFDHPIPSTWADEQQEAQPAGPSLDDIDARLAQIPEHGEAKKAILQQRGSNQGFLQCLECGEKMTPDEPPHRTVARIVRSKQKYGTAGAGAVVYIEPRHVPQALDSTMSLGEYRDLLARRARPVEKPKARLAQMVDDTLAAVQAQTKAIIQAGKDRIQHEAAVHVAEARKLLQEDLPPPQGASIDAEPPSQPRQSLTAIEDRLTALEGENARLRELLATKG